MEIRKATPEDAEGIDRVIRETWPETYEDIQTEESLNEIRESETLIDLEDLREWIQEDSTLYLVAEDDGEIVGEAILILEGDEEEIDYSEEAFLRSLYILPSHQGKGLGTRLLRKAEKELTEKFEKIKTMVISENSKAIKFYRKRGFKKCGKTNFGGEESLFEEKHETEILQKEV
jgi:ribosomal protein S18 acetylase RimI-like enzyme